MFYKTVGRGPFAFVLQDGAEYTGRHFWYLDELHTSLESRVCVRWNVPAARHNGFL